MKIEQLKDCVTYDPRTGVFHYRVDRGNFKAGDVAGGRDSRGRIKLCIAGKQYYANRLAYFYITGEWPEGIIEHINGDLSDNRLKNLRQISYTEAIRARRQGKNPLAGVSVQRWKDRNDSWRAYTDTVNGKVEHLYTGKDYFEACCRRKSWENSHLKG